MPSPLRVRLSLVALVVMAGPTACSTPPPQTSAAPVSTTPAPGDPFATLRVGEKADALRARLGAPHEIKPMPHEAVQSEVWVYRRPLPATTTQVASSIELVDAVDPLNGRAIKVPQPKHETVVIESDEVISLLLINGELTAWKTARESSRNFK